MRLHLAGINYQTAPVALRSYVAIRPENLSAACEVLRGFVPNAVILSTCNRTEIYTASESVEGAQHGSLDFLRGLMNGASEEILSHVYSYSDEPVVQHLFRVASGLESMIIGEYEVLGQVRTALETAEKCGMVNLPLRQVFQSAIRAGRHVHEETGLSRNPVSVSSVAVELAEQVVGDLRQCKVVVIGAGEAGKLVAKVAREKGAGQMVIANRTRERAEEIADELGAIPVGLNGLGVELDSAGVVIACAAAPHEILTGPYMDMIMKGRPDMPLVIIDIAVPRNVTPDVRGIANVHLYDIDDLTRVAEGNRKQREGEVHHAARIVSAELAKFREWWRDFEVRPVITSLMGRAEEIRVAQLNKTLKKLPPLTEEQRLALDSMTRAIINRILQDPIEYLKTNGNGHHTDLLKTVFQLDAEKTCAGK